MKYIDKFPDMKPIFDERECFIRGSEYQPCIICGCPTEFIEINYEAHLCSEECEAELGKLIDEAIMRAEVTVGRPQGENKNTV